MRSPTARTLAHLKGVIPAQVVEKWIPVRGHPGGGVRRDLFGCIDIVAIGNEVIIGIQSTSGSNHAAREKKAMHAPDLRKWLAAGACFEVWSWSKKATKRKDGSRGAKRWAPRVSRAHLIAGGLGLEFRKV